MAKRDRSMYVVHRLPGPIGCMLLIIPWAGFVALMIGATNVAYSALQRPIITSLYGSDAYAHGVRVTGKGDRLSNGEHLPVGWQIVLAFGSLAAVVPVVLIYGAILAALGIQTPDDLFEAWKEDERER